MELSPVNQETIPPSLGMLLDISAIPLAMATTDSIFLASYTLRPLILPLNSTRFSPRVTISGAHVPRLFSPTIAPNQPPSLGIASAILARPFAILVQDSIFLASSLDISLMDSAKSDRFSPRVGNCGAQTLRLFSPNIVPSQPPSFGMALAMLAMPSVTLVQVSILDTSSSVKPRIDPANLFRFSPRTDKPGAHFSRLFSPNIAPNNPPSFGMALAISAIPFAAFAHTPILSTASSSSDLIEL